MTKKKLGRYIQCAKCPWKVSTDPNQIPNGYSVEKHKALECTIAEPGMVRTQCYRAMACHESEPGKEAHCIGWLANQLGPGNNIGLRLQMLNYDLSGVHLDGKQHKTLEDTLPKENRRGTKRPSARRRSSTRSTEDGQPRI